MTEIHKRLQTFVQAHDAVLAEYCALVREAGSDVLATKGADGSVCLFRVEYLRQLAKAA